jgi:hypothetical protein
MHSLLLALGLAGAIVVLWPSGRPDAPPGEDLGDARPDDGPSIAIRTRFAQRIGAGDVLMRLRTDFERGNDPRVVLRRLDRLQP